MPPHRSDKTERESASKKRPIFIKKTYENRALFDKRKPSMQVGCIWMPPHRSNNTDRKYPLKKFISGLWKETY